MTKTEMLSLLGRTMMIGIVHKSRFDKLQVVVKIYFTINSYIQRNHEPNMDSTPF